ncbi:MAG: transposase, partial [Candidatus Methanoperedens sp.]|nr:transposase [Candidatus Methanoperedens sp.]
MEQWVKEIVKTEREKRKLPLEAKKLNNNYYLYHSTTRWDKEEKKVKKVSDYIGRITPKGVIELKKSNDVRSIYEYGNSELLHLLTNDIIEPLKKFFYDRWKEIIACSIVKTIQPLPLRLIKSRWEKLHISQKIDASLSPNTISEVLRDIGKDYASQKEFFDELMVDSKTLIFDLSSIFSYSENLQYAEKGHNADHLYLKQINFMLFFSMDKQLPVLLKPLPGSVRDVKALRTVIDEVNAKDSTVVIDRGFASYVVPDLLTEFDFNFILPLRRNFTEIDYDRKLDYTFSYRKRGIKWGRKRIGTNFLYLFEDVKLRAEEETTFINLMNEKKRNIEEYKEESKKFGKIAILSNRDKDGETIYLMWKDRENIEVAFDALKNELENDKTYLNDDDAVRGYFFISFL